MAKSSKKRKNGKVKPSIQRDFSGAISNSRTKSHNRKVNYKRMMRSQLLYQACESLTAEEVLKSMVSGSKMSYISTKLDENGVPVEGDTKDILITSADLPRLEAIYKNKLITESHK